MFKKLGTMFGAALLTLTIGLGMPPFTSITVSDAEAKGFSSSRSFSRSTFRSSSYSKPKPKFNTYKSDNKSSFKTTKKTDNIKTGNQKKQGLGYNNSSTKTKGVLAQKQERAKFKKPSTLKTSTGKPVDRSTINKRYSNNAVYSRSRSVDSSTYYARRDRYYGGYSTPTYVYNTSPSFGMWDTVFLYYMLSNANNASHFAYHHQNDPDYQAWRREADRLALQNAELRNQLAAMDKGRVNVTGPIDAGYLPKGVDPDIALSQEARNASLPELRVCTGSRSGAYFRLTAGVIAPNLSGVNVTVVETQGTGQILKAIADGKCDAGFVQGDGYWNFVEKHQTTTMPFERVFTPYKESAHLICHAKGPDSIGDLNSNHSVYFPSGSGAAETWTNFVGENTKYGNVKTVLNTPSMAVSSNEEALLKVANNKNACMMYVSAQGATKFMKTVDTTSRGQNLVLIDIDDSSLDNTTDPSGSDVYSFSYLSSSNYKNLLRQGGCYGLCGGDVKTVTMNTDFIISTAWKTKHSKIYPNVALELMGLQPNITAYIK